MIRMCCSVGNVETCATLFVVQIKQLRGTSKQDIIWPCSLPLVWGCLETKQLWESRTSICHCFLLCFLKWPEVFSVFLRVAQTEVFEPSGFWGSHRSPVSHLRICVWYFSCCSPCLYTAASSSAGWVVWWQVGASVCSFMSGQLFFKGSVRLVFPFLRVLFGTFKALQKCSHCSVGFLWARICATPVILGETQETGPRGPLSMGQALPNLLWLLVWPALPQVLWEILNVVKLVASDPGEFTASFGSQIWAMWNHLAQFQNQESTNVN